MGALALTGLKKKGRTIPADFAAKSEIAGHVPAYDAALVAAFLRCTSGDASFFRLPGGKIAVPPTFYVTWNMAVLAKAIVKLRLPFDFSRALHAGSEVRYGRPLHADERARFSGRVVSIDDNERRARIRFETVITSADDGAEIFRNAMELHVPKAVKKTTGPRPKPSEIFVSPALRALVDFSLPKDLGQRYAVVSGDFNPIHWSRTAARALGFKTLFVQGYCTKALIAHAVIRQLLRGASNKLQAVKVEFRKPVFLPGRVSLFLGEPEMHGEHVTRALALGTALESEALVTGSVEYLL